MMFRTICFKNPGPRTRQTDSWGVGPGSRRIKSTVRTVFFTGVPAFWKAAKSWVPMKAAAASSMAAKSSGPTAQTKGRRWGRRKSGSCQRVYA